MALPKHVKRGGSYYEGFQLVVSSTPGDYVIDMTLTTGTMVNTLSITPDSAGVGDSFTVAHLTSNTVDTVAVLAKNIPNLGANAAVNFDFPAYEEMSENEALRLTYTNTATVGMNVNIIVEYVGLTKTA